MSDSSLPEGYRLREAFEVSAADARVSLDAGDAILVDCRLDDEWEFAHVDGAVHLPLGEIERRADEIEADDETLVLVMCHHGVRSLRAALALQQLGFPQARSVVGGIDLWSQRIDPSVARYERGHGGCKAV